MYSLDERVINLQKKGAWSTTAELNSWSHFSQGHWMFDLGLDLGLVQVSWAGLV